jgi:hypothetical protein
MSVDKRNERYEWEAQDSMEVVSEGDGETINIEDLVNDSFEEPTTEVQPV